MRLIDADAFKKYITDGIDGLILPKDQAIKAIAVTKSFLKDIDEQPTVEARPHGEWKNERFSESHALYFGKCSQCGKTGVTGNFCSVCGSDNRKKVKRNEIQSY